MSLTCIYIRVAFERSEVALPVAPEVEDSRFVMTRQASVLAAGEGGRRGPGVGLG